MKKRIFGLFIIFLLHVQFLLPIQTVYAGINIILDLDDTVLKEAPVEQKANSRVQSLRYKPGDDFYKRYQARLEAKNSEPSKVIHYELHPGTQDITGYIVVRPGMKELLESISQDPTNKIYIASNNDPARTEAIVQGLKIGGKTLKAWGVTTIPKEVFNPSHTGEKKNLSAIRKWANLSPDAKLFAIDDHPEFYSEKSLSDQVIGITPWDYKNGILPYLSGRKSSKSIKKANILKLSQIWNEISPSESKAPIPFDPEHRPPSAFAIPTRSIDV